MSALFTKVLPWPKIIMVKSLTASWPNSKPVPRPEALFWKAVALGNIEHGVLFEKRDMAHFVRVGRLLDLGNEIHLDPVFPFADDSADVEGLFECEPTLGCVPVRP